MTSWPGGDGRLAATATATALAVAACLCVLPFIVTLALTSAPFGRRPGTPAQVPYAIPFVRNTFQFAPDVEGFISSMIRRFDGKPFRFFAGADTFYFVPYGEPVLALFRQMRDMTSKPLVTAVLRGQLGVPRQDVAIWARDDSGINVKPLPGSEDIDPAQRIFFLSHQGLHDGLAGTAGLTGMLARFVANYTARLRAAPVVAGESWVGMPDVFEFFKREMFHGTSPALCGENLLRLSPGFADDFWAFDKNMMTYLRRVPRWFAPEAYAARDRAIESVDKWRQHAAETFDEGFADAEFEPAWGARLMRNRADMFRGLGISDRGTAAVDFGLIWAANSNAILSTVWAMVFVHRSPGLARRVRAETEACFDVRTGSFDVAALCSKPLLSSVHMETLRVTVGASTARNALTDNFELDGKWAMERDAIILTINWFGAHDADFWNTGRVLASSGKPEHPVDEFWAERFLEYPGDPASGPIRKPDASIYSAPALDDKPDGTRREKTAEDDKTATLVTTGLQGHYYPFGGGQNICPGRFFAKQSALAALAITMREFDIEFPDADTAWNVQPNKGNFPVGTCHPDRKVPVKLRRRQNKSN
ncbi:cytochrome P450 [Lasiosphaeria miniovina]|uniref:Cytochrome P450 n=1 Tax=Lasiosphaeria miniovina TaxID=1954250 RepID=A0AA40ADN1_9PEZI|nr:cytochrome P450 [Lasiosphaeria miniovina]KAK0713921.1 cytochrome P450 [Lasiosphaeria miniovina]